MTSKLLSIFIIISFLLVPLFLSQLLDNSSNFTNFQTSFICLSNNSILNNLTNSPHALAHCFTYTILGTQALADDLDNYQYDEDSHLYWLEEGISHHFIFKNNSYDLGITNVTYDEFIQYKEWIENNLS